MTQVHNDATSGNPRSRRDKARLRIADQSQQLVSSGSAGLSSAHRSTEVTQVSREIIANPLQQVLLQLAVRANLTPIVDCQRRQDPNDDK